MNARTSTLLLLWTMVLPWAVPGPVAAQTPVPTPVWNPGASVEDVHVVFAGGERRALASRFAFLEVESDVELLTQGERADGLYILLSGEAEVSLRGEPLQKLLPGDVFGELSLMDGSPSEESVTSLTKCFVLRLDAGAFREIIMTHPQVLEYLAELADARREVRQGLFSDYPPPVH